MVVDQIGVLLDKQQECIELLALAVAEDDTAVLQEIELEVCRLREQVDVLIFQQRFTGPVVSNNSYLVVQAGSG